MSRELSSVVLAPSLLAADQSDLRSAIEAVEGEADVFHIDVMDGHFVPNMSMGPAVVEGVSGRTSRPLDVHLMIESPERWIEPFREAGADWISLHAEATVHLEAALGRVRSTGARAGVALNPGTSLDGLEYVLQDGDYVLVMSVNPGFGGQRFLPRSLDKIAALRELLDRHGLRGVDIEVDGGVDVGNAGACHGAGARILVAGSSIVGAEEPAAAARALRAAALEGAGAGE